MKYMIRLFVLVSGLAFASCMSFAATTDLPIATINPRKILSDSKLAKEALVRFQADFLPKDKELQSLATSLKEKTAELEKTGSGMSPSQLKEKQGELDALTRDFKRKQQQFVEDRDARKRDDIQRILGIATQVVKKIADGSHIDMVFQDVVYANPKTDITARVIEMMDAQTDK